MAIYDILCEVKDVREADTGICEFNGFLEDYLSIIETAEGKEDDYTILSQLFEKDHNLKICANLRLNINKDAIANQINLNCRREQSNVRMLYMEALMNTRRRLFLHWEIKRNM